MKAVLLLSCCVLSILAAGASNSKAQILQDTLNFGTITMCEWTDTAFTLSNSSDKSVTVVRSGDSCGCWFDSLDSMEMGPKQALSLHAFWSFTNPGNIQDTLSWYVNPGALIRRTILIVQATDIHLFVALPSKINLGTVLAGTSRDSFAVVGNGGCDTLQVSGIRLVGSSAFVLDSLSPWPRAFGPGAIGMIRYSFHPALPGPDSAVIIAHATDGIFDTVAYMKIVANVIAPSSVSPAFESQQFAIVYAISSGAPLLQIRGMASAQDVALSFYDVVGRMLGRENIGTMAGSQTVPLALPLATGCYYAHVTSAGRTLAVLPVILTGK